MKQHVEKQRKRKETKAAWLVNAHCKKNIDVKKDLPDKDWVYTGNKGPKKGLLNGKKRRVSVKTDRQRLMEEQNGSKLNRLGTGQGDMGGLSKFSYIGWLIYGSFAIFVFISVIYLGIRFNVAVNWRASHPSDWVSCSAGRPADQTIEYKLSTEQALTEPRPPMYPDAGGLGRDVTDSDRWLIMQILTIVENMLIIQPMMQLALAALSLYLEMGSGEMESKEDGVAVAHAARTCNRKRESGQEIGEHVNLVDFLYPHDQLSRVVEMSGQSIMEDRNHASLHPPNGIFPHGGVTRPEGIERVLSHERNETMLGD